MLTAKENDWSLVKCPSDKKLIANEIIDYWLKGPTLPKKSFCLQQKFFKYIAPEHIPPMERKVSNPTVLNEDYKVKIVSIKKAELGEYKVKFEIEDNRKTYKDELMFMTFDLRKGETRKAPCASLSMEPSRNFIIRKCLP